MRGRFLAPARPRPGCIRACLESQPCGPGTSLPSRTLPLASGRRPCDAGLARGANGPGSRTASTGRSLGVDPCRCVENQPGLRRGGRLGGGGEKRKAAKAARWEW